MTDVPDCESHRRLHAVPRGLLRLIIARLLESSEMSGMDIIRVLEERSNGTWTPSPGSIYPLLAQMEENGYIQTVRVDGRSKTYRLAPEGESLLKRIRDHKSMLLEKMKLGPLFWLGILDPMDQAMAYTDLITIAFERLHLIEPSLKVSQKKRVVKRLRRIQTELQEIISKLEQRSSSE